MGLYIKGMEMPTAGMCKTITIFDDGVVVEGNGSEKLGIAIHILPHGNLKDADAIRKDWLENYRHALTRSILDSLDDAPTIIEAEEDNE